MDRRTLAALVVLLAASGWFGALLAPSRAWSSFADAGAFPGRPVHGFVTAVSVGVVALAAVAALVLLAHQYVRWREYRPAIHLLVAVVVFVAVTAWWLGPAGIGSAREPLRRREAAVIRIMALLLSVTALLLLSRYFPRSNGGEG